VSWPRLRKRLDALAEVGALPNGGCSRLALTDADGAGRDVVLGWMHDLGLRVVIDGIGNAVGTWPAASTAAAVLAGSHIDTVATGGRYDGCLGVLAGLEVLETVIERGISTDHPMGVAFFTDEEGSRFAPDMLGSLVYVGGLALEDALASVAVDGAILGEELERIGYAGAGACPAPPPHAYVELHIEQGPVLEATGDTIGAVTGVQGISWTEITITGQSNHAGTTPMTMRRDAGWAAASIATFVRQMVTDMGAPMVGTVGRLTLHPNLVNVVAANATLTVDLRHTDDGVLTEAEERLRSFCDHLAGVEGVEIELRELSRFAPVVFAADIVDLVEEVASAQGARVRRLPSGAGHDAQMLARVCPAGMIFVPSTGGLSHNPGEHTDDAQVEAGANVLLHVMLQLAGGR
jgi:N-carbamoyl-L-amino-acid hydrolase